MYISLKALQKLNFVDKAIIHSHDQSLYLLSVEIDGKEYFVKTSKNSFLESSSKTGILSQSPITKLGDVWLRQNTPYDEMIGLSVGVDNTLAVQIGGVFYSEEMYESDSIH